MTSDSRPIAGIDTDAVSRWLADNVDGFAGPAQFSLIAGGRSNLTYLVTDSGGRRVALRRPPTGSVLESAHDMGREWKFVSALQGTGVPVAQPLAFCQDQSVTGADFYVMDFVDGIVLGDAEDATQLTEQARHHADIARCRPVRKQPIALNDIADAAAQGDRGSFADRHAVNQDLP